MSPRCFPLLLFASLSAGAAGAQSSSPGHEDWIRARFGAELHRTTPRAAVAEASSAGLVPTDADLLAFKRAFRHLKSKGRHGRPHWQQDQLEVVPASMPPAGLPETFVLEQEFNDVWSMADTVGTTPVVSGDNFRVRDVDSFRFTSNGNEMIVASVLGVGPGAITDSTITIRNGLGDPIGFVDVPGNETVRFWPGQGPFSLDVGSWRNPAQPTVNHGGTYDLVVARQPLAGGAPRMLVPGTTTGTFVGPTGNADLLQFTLAVPSRVQIQVTSTRDSMLAIQRADGPFAFFNDDSSRGLHAGADVDLPSGTWVLEVRDAQPTGTLTSWSLNFAATPTPMPDLLAGGPVVGSILGEESLRRYSVDASGGGASLLDLLTNPPPSGTGIFDALCSLFDARGNVLLDSDDDAPATHGQYSRIRATLPGAGYTLAVAGAPGRTGSFQVSGSVSAPVFAGNVRLGANALTIGPSGAMNSYRFGSRNDGPVRFVANQYPFTLVGWDGNLAGTMQLPPEYPQSAHLPQGDNVLVAWDRDAATRPLNLQVLGTVAFENGRIVTKGKVGDWTLLFADFGPLTPGVNFGLGDHGFFELGPSAFTGGIFVNPGTGEIDWGAKPPFATGAHLQAGQVFTGSFRPAYPLVGPQPMGTWQLRVTDD